MKLKTWKLFVHACIELLWICIFEHELYRTNRIEHKISHACMIFMSFMILSVICTIWNWFGVKNLHAFMIDEDMELVYSWMHMFWNYVKNSKWFFGKGTMILSYWPYIVIVIMLCNMFPCFGVQNMSLAPLNVKLKLKQLAGKPRIRYVRSSLKC